MDLRPLSRNFYARPALELARELIGRLLVRELNGRLLIGRVVEAEAYGPDDPASHSYRGPTPRNASMFGSPGHAYVYVSHGIHQCLNAVAEPPSAVLVRALEPIEGLEEMRRRRRTERERLLCAGPGRLCEALGIGPNLDGHDLTLGEGLWIARGHRARDVVVTPRIGLSVAMDRPWRFVRAGSPFASRGTGVRRPIRVRPGSP
ncbi:MAG TPA: DNA-3-methyladenine glycosylase [Actinomycetota bacterium]|nr:DNA-3-methyladenine glycosylase [Actinomycetota bacterium]